METTEKKTPSPEEVALTATAALTQSARDLLLSLCRIRSVSGFEGNPRAAAALAEAVKDCGGFDEIRHTPGGNHIFIRYGKRHSEGDAPRFMLDAHFDEIGLMVQGISDEGLLTVSSLGGIDLRTMAAGRFALLTEKEEIPAICCPPAVTAGGVDARKPGDWKNLPLFTGFTKEQLSAKGVRIGTPVGFAGEPLELADGSLSFRGFDNKAGAAAIFLAAKLLAEKELDCDLCLLLSSGEESHMTGAKTGTASLLPSQAIVVDVDFAVTPDVDRKKAADPGKGPSVTLSVQTDREMTKRILALGKEKEIPCQQILGPDSTGTNAIAVPFLGGGVPTAVVSVPIKYMHTYAETLLTEDIVSTARLLAAYIAEKYEQGGTEV